MAGGIEDPSPERIREGFDEVRESGLTNMFDRTAVCRLLEKFGYPDVADYFTIQKNYSTFLQNYS